jgi:hypothetical protein
MVYKENKHTFFTDSKSNTSSEKEYKNSFLINELLTTSVYKNAQIVSM